MSWYLILIGDENTISLENFHNRSIKQLLKSLLVPTHGLSIIGPESHILNHLEGFLQIVLFRKFCEKVKMIYLSQK